MLHKVNFTSSQSMRYFQQTPLIIQLQTEVVLKIARLVGTAIRPTSDA